MCHKYLIFWTAGLFFTFAVLTKRYHVFRVYEASYPIRGSNSGHYRFQSFLEGHGEPIRRQQRPGDGKISDGQSGH